jgi:LPXTG-motif cell wall-anchored protein
MHKNEILLVIAGVILIGLVLFTLYRNRKDEEEFEQELNEPDMQPERHLEAEDPEDLKGS